MPGSKPELSVPIAIANSDVGLDVGPDCSRYLVRFFYSPELRISLSTHTCLRILLLWHTAPIELWLLYVRAYYAVLATFGDFRLTSVRTYVRESLLATWSMG